MSDATRRAVAPTPIPAPDHSSDIAALRLAGAAQLDPVRLHYLELLNARAQTQSTVVQGLLSGKLQQALADMQLRLERQQSSEGQVPATAPNAPLSELVRSLARNATETSSATPGDSVVARVELKAIRQFRNTWSKLSADKQVAKALDQAPKNAGPINSHMLVLRSLALMRDIAPDYLNRFMTYADTLLCLDQHAQQAFALPAKPAATEAVKKPKAKHIRTK